MKNLINLLRYILPYWVFALFNIVFNILSVIFSLFSLAMVVPFLSLLFGKEQLVRDYKAFALNTDTIIHNFNYLISKIIITYGKVDALIFVCIMVAVLFFLKNLFRYLGMYFLAPIRNGVVQDIRNDIFHKILILPLSYYTEQKKGDIISRMTTDAQEIEWSIMSSLEMIFREPISILFFLGSLMWISPKLTLFVLFLLPITGYIIGRISKNLKTNSFIVQEKMGIILSMVEEAISGLKIIKAFNGIPTAYRRFKKVNGNYTKLRVSIYRKVDLASPLSEFLGAVVLVIVLWFGGKLVLSGDQEIKPEVFIAYVVIFSQLITPVKNLTTAYYNIQKGLASTDRINHIMDAPEVIEEKPNAISVNDFKDSIKYNNVSFNYVSEPVLVNVNLTIEKGKTIAVVGPSGSGKTTMVDLLPRFYDCVDGQIEIDGIPIKDFVISDLRQLMGIVTQESILFNDTIYNNIAFGMKNVTKENVIEAAKIANAHNFIMESENGYDTVIGDRGVKLSGGQRQRLSIARAILKNPPILILDEATSALDTESERLVQDALIKLMENRTSIVIAHRLSTIQHADEIIVLQKGVIVERGKHNELVAMDGVYKKLCELQTFI